MAEYLAEERTEVGGFLPTPALLTPPSPKAPLVPPFLAEEVPPLLDPAYLLSSGGNELCDWETLERPWFTVDLSLPATTRLVVLPDFRFWRDPPATLDVLGEEGIP